MMGYGLAAKQLATKTTADMTSAAVGGGTLSCHVGTRIFLGLPPESWDIEPKPLAALTSCTFALYLH